MNDPVETVLAALTQAGCSPSQVKPDQWESRCPAHRGSRANLAISRGHDGRCLIYCHHADSSGQGCRPEEILAALNLAPRDLFADGEGTPIPEGRLACKPSRAKSTGKARKVHETTRDAAKAIAWSLNKDDRNKPKAATWKPIRGWRYHDATGAEVFEAIRLECWSDAANTMLDKTYRPIHRVGDGWVVGDPPGKLPLLGLPGVIAAARVFVAEGEKCAELAQGLGLVASTPAHGAKSPHKTDWSPLAGKDVVLLPDADAAGEGFAKLVGDLLSALTPPPTIRVVRLPGLDEGGDIEQWLAARPQDPVEDPAWRDEARAELLALVEATPAEAARAAGVVKPHGVHQPNEVAPTGPRWAPGLTVKARDRDNYGKVVADLGDRVSVHFISPGGHEADVILDKTLLEPTQIPTSPPTFAGDPEPLAGKLLPVPPMPPELIPGPLRPWLVDIAERVGCSVEFPVVGAIVAAASLVGRKVGIRPKRHDDWLVVPNLWGAVVGRPGIMKTPALGEAMKPLRRMEGEANEGHRAALAARQSTSLVRKIQAEVVKESLKRAYKSKADTPQAELDELTRKATDDPDDELPTCRRYIVNDSTVEKLGELLSDNPTGLLIFRDELTGWFKALDKPGHETDRTFYLEAWNGMGAFTYDRIGRGTLVIPSPCVSILGGIQPGPFRDHLKATAAGGAADDGLISRFQVLVYPDQAERWVNVDRPPDRSAQERADAVFRRLNALDGVGIGASTDFDDGLPYLRFDHEAQGLFDEWRSDLENNKLRVDGQPTFLESHLAKYRSLMPSLALLFHLIELANGGTPRTVTQGSAQLAAAWCDFLEAHARRIYATLEDTAQDSARALAERIKAGEVSTPFVARAIYRKGWSRLKTADDVDAAVANLEGLNWLACVGTTDTGGAPRTDIHLHPTLVKAGVAG